MAAEPEKRIAQLEHENMCLQQRIADLYDMQNHMGDLAIDKQAIDKVRNEEKQKQDRYMSLLQANVPDIILMFDRDAMLVNCTDSYLKATGVHGFSHVSGKHVSYIMAEYGLDRSHEPESVFEEVLSSGEVFSSTVRFDFSKDGIGREYEVLTVPIIDDTGDTDGIVALIHDITDLMQRERMVGALNDMATTFLSQSIETFDKTMTEGIGYIVDLISLDRVSLWRNTESEEGLCASQIYRWARDTGVATQKEVSIPELSYVQTAPRWEGLLSRGDTINASIYDLPESSFLASLGCESLFVSPVHIEGVFWGFAAFEDLTSTRIFSSSEASTLHSAALMMGNAMNSYEKAVATHDADERMRLLLNATPMGCQVLDDVGNILDCNEAAVDLFGYTDKSEYAACVYEYSPEFQPDGRLSCEKADEYMQRAFKEGSYTFEWMHRAKNGDPLPTNVTLVRVKYKDHDVLAAYTWDLRVTRKMEESIKRLESEVDKIYIDPLTGISNRRFLDETLADTMAYLSRSQSTLSLLMIDIDNFKLYNDTYGHTVGDSCLISIANALSASLLRKNDFVARYGGEEFAVILPNTEQAGAYKIAEKLLESVRRCAILHEKNEHSNYVTVSIGVTTGTVRHLQSPKDYIRQADEALYQAKQDGGDCYRFAEFAAPS